MLAAVVEVVTGLSFGEYMRKNIFDPLGMKEIWYQIPEDKYSRLAAQYMLDINTGAMFPQQGNTYRLSEKYESGGAGVTTSVDEYSKLLDALACGGKSATGERILEESSVALMRTNQLNESEIKEFQQGFRKNYGYGLGVRVKLGEAGGKSPAGEFGWDGAAGAYALMDPVNHISVYYAQQILNMLKSYTEIHPAVRDLIYESL